MLEKFSKFIYLILYFIDKFISIFAKKFNSNKILVYSDRKDRFFGKEITKYLNKKNIKYLKLNYNFFEIFSHYFNKKANLRDTFNNVWIEKPSIYLIVFLKILKLYKKFSYKLDQEELDSYFVFLEKIEFWKNFFTDQNIKINLNHSGDTGFQHVVQSIALDQINAINVKDLRSYHMKEDLFISKEFHLFFNWGKQFSCSKNTVKDYNNHQIITGYPFDYLFPKITNNILREKEEIIIALFDTTISTNYIYKFYKNFLKIISEKNNIKLAIKTKGYKKLINLLIDESLARKLHNRISFYNGPPCFIGKYADLSVCLGINTAGIETALSGSNSVIYWVPDNYIHCNQLTSEKKLVFTDIEKINDIILNNNFINNSIGNHGNIINDISPFNDHKSKDRICFIIEKLLYYYSQGLDADKAIKSSIKNYGEKWGKTYCDL